MAVFSEKSDLLLLAKNLKKKVNGLLTVYGLLIFGTIVLFLVVVGLCGLAVWGMWESGRIYGRAVVLLIGAIVVAGICVKVVLEPLFKIFEKRKNDGKEIKRADYPELFALIDEVVEKVDCLQPKHVYLSDECNAYVNYPSMWGYIFHGRQNLTIGLPLLFGMNKTEFKSILSHEFGHFTQKSVNVNRVANLSEFLCAAIAQSQEDMEKADDDSYEAKARLFARIATRIMLKQYHKVAPLNGILSRAQEYDADKHSYEVVGSEGSMSALCKIQDQSTRWNGMFLRWLWDRIGEERQPENVRDLFQKFSARIDERVLTQLVPTEHLYPTLGQYDSRIRSLENTDTHPSINQRCHAIAAYPKKDTVWDDAPAYDYFPDKVIENTFNGVITNLTKKRFPGTTTFLKKNVQDEELLSRANNFTSTLLDFFYSDSIFYEYESLNPDLSDEDSVEFPFTQKNANRIREYLVAKNDLLTLKKVIDDNSAQLHFLYNGKEYQGTDVPIDEHRAYCQPLFDDAHNIAVDCYKWLHAQMKSHEDLIPVFRSMILSKRLDVILQQSRDDMQSVYDIGYRQIRNTKAKEFVAAVENEFRKQIAFLFDTTHQEVSYFDNTCNALHVPDDMRKQVYEYIGKPKGDSEQELCTAYSNIGRIMQAEFEDTWRIIKNELIQPIFIKQKETRNEKD